MSLKKVMIAIIFCLASVGVYFVYQANQERPSIDVNSAFLTICNTSMAHTAPQITYRVAGDEISIEQFLIPSDYLIFNNGCHEKPETVSRAEIEKTYRERKDNQGRDRITNELVYAVFPDFKPLEIEESFFHVKKPSVTHLNDLIIISIGNGMHIAKPPIDPQPYLREFSKTEPIQLKNGIVKYEYDPETAKVYPSQFDKYFQEKDGQFIRFFRCRRDFENEELGACEYTFSSDDLPLTITVYFNRNRIQDIEDIETGAKKLVQSFMSENYE